MRFLLSRRWVVFAVTVAFLAWVSWQLGQWQFHRLEDRKLSNSTVARNLDTPPVPVQDVLSTTRTVGPEQEWRRVTATGRWDDQYTIVLKYQSRNSGAGADVVTPLVTRDGTAVLVDRGWMPTTNSGAARPDLPAVTAGQVTVTGYVRVDATGSATKVADLATRALSSRAAAPVVPYPLMRGFLDLAAESPAPAKALQPVVLPDDTSNGPHFFYGLQWWFFGVLAVFGFCYLAYDEVRQRRRARTPQSVRSIPPSTGRQAPVTNDDAGLSRNAAADANSSGLP